MFERMELDDLRSIGDLSSYQREVQSRLQELEEEHSGLPFPDEARAEFAGLSGQNDEINKRVEELEAREQMLRRFAEDPKRVEREYTEFDRQLNGRDARGTAKERDIYDLSTMRWDPSSPERMREQYRDRAMRAIETARFAGYNAAGQKVDRAKAQEHIEHLLHTTQEGEGDSPDPGATARHLLQTGSPVYRRAFWKQMAGSMLDREEQRALSIGAGAGGGFAIPFALDPTLIPISNSVVNPARALARVETIAGANTWLGVTSAAITASYVAELTEATDTAGTPLLQPTATVTKAHAFVPFSIEIGEDWTALESQFTMLIGQAKDDLEGAQFVTGTGLTVFPQGFETAAEASPNNVAGPSGLGLTAANIYAMEAALPPRFRPNESFVANRGIYNLIRALDTAGGAQLWLYMAQGLDTQAPRPGNTGATLLGRGAWEASAMPAAVTATKASIIVGDFNYFLIVDRIGMTVELVPHIFGATARYPIGQRGLYAYWRNTSKALTVNAFARVTGTT